MKETEKRLEIFVREKHQKDEKGNVIKSFNTYATKTKDGKFMQVKFTKSAGYPKFQSRGYITVDKNDMNISDAGLYPVLWINKIISEEEYKRDLSRLDEMFE